MRRSASSSRSVIILILFLVACAAAFSSTACTKSETTNADRITDGAGGSGDDSEEPDYNYCLEAFDDMASRCGAQFYSDSGVLFSQNDLVKSCARPHASCAIDCYRADKNCDPLKTCLENTCGLK